MGPRRNSAFDRGSWVFIQHPTDSWRPSKLVSDDGKVVSLEDNEGGRTTVKTADFKNLEACGASMNLDLPNLVDLDVFSEGSILHHVRKR